MTPLDEVAMLMKDNCLRIFNLSNQYYIIAEHDVVTKFANMSDAIFYWFAVQYVFNIQYSKILSSVGYYLQDNIFDLTDRGARTSKYYLVVGDIRQYL